ncbi:Protein RTM1 [Lasiodiplodia hormozganensis]|uniref:Protein RTM1 n=1 Tax=Lasiodiplodia hormozganensis TaxID=869390 RepID=A0AA39YJU4_9PEZI|nr:Protein RTM1 [Lasiodiplodia hormozganensis]
MHNHTLVARDAPFDLIPYNPSATAAWAFVVLFAIAGTVHFFYLCFLRAWFFIPLVLGCVGEAFGYYGRVLAHDHQRKVGPFLLQLMLILASPPFLAATIYMTLGRVIRALDGEHHSIMRTKWVSKIYVLVDIACFGMQMYGSAIQGSGDAAAAAQGMRIVLGGLIFQLVVFVFFIAMAAVFHLRANREPTRISRRPGIEGLWRKCMWALYVVSALVLVRNGYRIAEFADKSKTIEKHEAPMYVFDAGLMFLVPVVLAVMHPGRLMRMIRKMKDLPPQDDSECVPLDNPPRANEWTQWR